MTHESSAVSEVTRPISSVSSVRATMPDFEELYEQYADFVFRNARQLGVLPASLDDVVQDVFWVVHRRHGELTSSERVRSWMYGIVIRVVRDYRRRDRRKELHLRTVGRGTEPDTLPDGHATSPFVAAAQSDALRILNAILNELDDAKREAFVLAELEEMTELQIAEILGENINTVHSRLRAARHEFEQAVRRHRSRDEWRLR